MTTWPGFGDIAEPYQEFPFVCRLCRRRFRLLTSAYTCEERCGGKKPVLNEHFMSGFYVPHDAPEVTEAMKIMYPKEK